jgi:methionyl-tRNA synthetase
MLHQYFNGVVPAAEGDLGLRVAAVDALPRIEDGYVSLDYAGALSTVWEVVALGNRTIEEQKPWSKIKAGDAESVAILLCELLAVCQWCAVTLAPVMPHVTERLRRLLALEVAPSWNQAADASLLPAGHRCLAPEPLFPRISKIKEDDLMEVTSETPASPPQAEAPVAAATPPTPEPAANDTIEYADFAKVQLRAGRVLEAERVPKADKLLRLQVDLGTERRQILAGIAQQFEPEALIGKTIVVVANLAPRKLRGFESQGMLLAASADADSPPLGLVTISEDVPPGSLIK